jgi:hypothetical protein
MSCQRIGRASDGESQNRISTEVACEQDRGVPVVL